jgi:integrase
LENGADLPTIQILMGHADLEATSIYLHLSRRHLERVGKAMTWVQEVSRRKIQVQASQPRLR